MEGHRRLSDMATVNINVTDVNDNSPVFGQAVYAAVVSEDAELGKTILTVVADDADGPSNNQVRYSIVDGNQGSPFTIDPLKGEVKVARHLDREKTSGYTLTVVASDGGSPLRSSSTTINIDVSDINDNPPVFSQSNYSIIIQENRPVGTSILRLTVSDRDASHNGPPFNFNIVSGNENNGFHITPQGTLVSTATLSRRTRDHYLLQTRVSDSGRPPLSSSVFISVRLVEESVHPPSVLPLDVFITTATDEYPARRLGSSPLFSVSPTDGKLVALSGLDSGQYTLNATVTDGRFTSATRVSVHVRRAAAHMLENSIGVRFACDSPRGVHRRLLEELPAGITQHRRCQEGGRPAGQPPAGRRRLRRPGGPPGPGEETVTLETGAASTYQHGESQLHHSTAHSQRPGVSVRVRMGVVVSFWRGAECQCSVSCVGSPCPDGMECVEDPTHTKFSCVCSDEKSGQCSEGQALTFSGNGYARYRLMENENKEEMNLSPQTPHLL
ncbi:hypothetical protein SRHO_G00247420 [Serrasalmus rhombeus]